MSVIIDKLHMINRALARIGASAVQSLDDDVPNAPELGLAYEGVTDFLIGLYPWSWAFVWRKLNEISSAYEPMGYAHVFRLPADRMAQPQRYAVSPMDMHPVMDVFVNGDEVYANEETMMARIKVIPHPVAWSATFREAHTLYLAAQFARQMRNDEKAASELTLRAVGNPSENFMGGALGAARREDARNTPAEVIDGSNMLMTSWRTG